MRLSEVGHNELALLGLFRVVLTSIQCADPLLRSRGPVLNDGIWLIADKKGDRQPDFRIEPFAWPPFDYELARSPISRT